MSQSSFARKNFRHRRRVSGKLSLVTLPVISITIRFDLLYICSGVSPSMKTGQTALEQRPKETRVVLDEFNSDLNLMIGNDGYVMFFIILQEQRKSH